MRQLPGGWHARPAPPQPGRLAVTRPQCVTKVQHAFPPTFVTGSVFWPTANIFNFMLVPPHLRVPYVNVAGVSKGRGAACACVCVCVWKPPGVRLPCAAAASGTDFSEAHCMLISSWQLFWNAWLSYENSTKGRVEAAAAATAAERQHHGGAAGGR